MDQPIKSGDIRQRLEANAQRLGELREALRPYALTAMTGDKAAAKKVAEIADEERTLRSEVTTFEVALEEALRLEEEAAKLAMEEDRQRRMAEARRIGEQIVEAARRFDVLAAEMGAVLRRRQELAREVWQTGMVPDGYSHAMRRPHLIASALAHAGLGEFGVVNGSGTRARTLEQADAGYFGARIGGAPSAPDEDDVDESAGPTDAEVETLRKAGL
ncbi:hypothetical protein [Mesorhizobium sp. 43Arga]